MVKRESDVDVESELAIESASPWPARVGGRGGYGRTGFLKADTKKTFPIVPTVARTVNRHRWVGRVYPGA